MVYLLTTLNFFVFLSFCYAVNVKGTVFNQNSFPLQNITVYVEGGDSAKTDINGNFTISVDNFPYVITTVSENKLTATRFEDVMTNNPQLFIHYTFPFKKNQSFIRTSIPMLKENETGYIQFLSKDPFISATKRINPGTDLSSLNIEWSENKKSIDGYVLYILKSDIKYIGYALIPVTLDHTRNSYNIRISSINITALSTNIATINYHQSDYGVKGRVGVYAEFPAYGHVDLPLPKIENVYSGIVPGNLPLDYVLKARYTQNPYRNETGSILSVKYFSPGRNIDFQKETVPQILSPLDGFASYDNETLFSYGMDLGTGIYAVSFSGEGNFTIVTSSKNIKSPIEKSYGVLKGSEIKWSVYKYKSFNSVNEYVKKTINTKLPETSVTHSRTMSFKVFD